MKKKYSKNFWILSISMFFFMMSFNLILPELNHFITLLKGEDYKGWIITFFTISAAISRPFSGKLADTIGRKKVMNIGIVVCFVISLLYPLSTSIWFFLLLRFLHGFSAGFLPTGATALVIDILPANQRGQAMGIWGTFISLGIGVGQLMGSWIYLNFGMDNLFISAATTSLLAGILLQFVKETLKNKQVFKPALLRITLRDVFEPSVLPAATVMFLTSISSGIIFVLTPDMSAYIGLNNKGYFFGIYVVTTILIRLFTSSLSDKIGRRKTLLIGISLLITSMFLIGFSRTFYSYTIAAAVFGLATGINSPTLFAWTADLSHADRRGIGSGTMFIALELGIMAGSLSTLFTYRNTLDSIPLGFSTGIIIGFLALVYLVWHLKFKQSNT
jgi:MFS family permease